MKYFKSFLAVAAFFAACSTFAADAKINDKVVKTKNNTITATYVFSSFDKAAPELKLTQQDIYQHPKHKYINGLLNPITIQITAPSEIKYLNLYGSACNYSDCRERVYTTEYSVDNKEWIEVGKDKKPGGWAYVKGEVKEMKKNNGTVYIRFRKITEPDDRNGLKGPVLFKKISFIAKF